MFLMGLVLPLMWSWTCDHDELQKSVTVKQGAQLLNGPQLGVRKPIRITLDTTYIDTANPYGLETCKEERQIIRWNKLIYVCQKEDVWTKEKMKVIKGTFANVKKYLESTLKVFQIEDWDPNRDYEDYPVPLKEGEKVTGADLYIVLYPRPFGVGSNTLAAALYLNTDSIGRPIQGGVNVNLAAVPKRVQDFSTVGDRQFFEVALHEVCHVLGISDDAFGNWRNITSTGEGNAVDTPKYTEPIMYTRKVGGKEMKILHTPKLHELMRERLGIEYFDNNEEYPVGVEIEDYGDSGTAGSHWEARVFFTELMTGASIGYARISDVTLCALEDSGWYEVNHSVAEPLEWGDYRSIRGAKQEQFKNFADGKPVEVWPDHYFAEKPPPKEGSSLACTFDHRSVASFSFKSNRECGNNSLEECQYPDFYDPKGTGYYGVPLVDYLLVPTPQEGLKCWARADENKINMTGAIPGLYFGPNSMCARTTLGLGDLDTHACFRMGCDEEGTLSIGVGKEAKQCKGKGDRLEFPNTKYDGYVECPDPNIVCGILGYNGTSSPIPEYTGEDVRNPYVESPGGGKLGLWIGVGVGCVVVIVVIAVVVTLVVRGCSSKSSKKDKEEVSP